MKHYLIVFMSMLLTACAGFQTPQSMEDRVMYSQAQLIATYESIADLAEQGRISKGQAVDLLRLADEADVVLGLTKAALGGGDLSTAQQKLSLAQRVLLQLEITLKESQDE